MTAKTPEQLQADWIAEGNVALFSEKLKSETDHFRHMILAGLLADELEKLEKLKGKSFY